MNFVDWIGSNSLVRKEENPPLWRKKPSKMRRWKCLGKKRGAFGKPKILRG